MNTPSPTPNSSFMTLPPAEEPTEVDTEPEDEVDQLESDSESENPQNSKKNGSTTHIEQRLPGHSWLPEQRVQSMVQADGVTGNLTLSKEALFILSVATEEFIRRLIQGGQRQAAAERRHSIIYHDMSATTQQYQEFMFLKDIIPAPLSLSEALQLRKALEKQLVDEDPALGAPASKTPTHTSTSFASSSKAAKARLTNGIDKPKKQPQKPSANPYDTQIYSFSPAASYYTEAARLAPHLAQHAWNSREAVTGILDARPWTNWSSTALTTPATANRHSTARASQNGHVQLPLVSSSFSVQALNGHSSLPLPSASPSTLPLHSQSNSSSKPRDDAMQVDPKPAVPEPKASASRSPTIETSTPNETTAPTSSINSLLSGPPEQHPFRSGQNPGRTIYSQQRTAQS